MNIEYKETKIEVFAVETKGTKGETKWVYDCLVDGGYFGTALCGKHLDDYLAEIVARVDKGLPVFTL